MALSKNARVGKDDYEDDVSFALPKHNYGNGAGMYAKRNTKGTRGSQTVGSIKSETCQANATKRYMAKSSRSYKHRDYLSWLEKTWKTNFNGMSFEQYKEEYLDG